MKTSDFLTKTFTGQDFKDAVEAVEKTIYEPDENGKATYGEYIQLLQFYDYVKMMKAHLEKSSVEAEISGGSK